LKYVDVDEDAENQLDREDDKRRGVGTCKGNYYEHIGKVSTDGLGMFSDVRIFSMIL